MPHMISFKNLSDFLICEKKHYLKNNLLLRGKENPFMDFQINLLDKLKTIIIEAVPHEEAVIVLSEHISKIEPKWFDLTQEMEQHKKNLTTMYLRFLDYYFSNDVKVISFQEKFKVQFNDFEILSKVDFVFCSDSGYEAVKFKLSTPKLSSFARTEENKPENCLELALMYEGLKYHYGGNLKVSFYHLVSKDDTSIKLDPVFNPKVNKNIVSAIFYSAKAQQTIRRVLENRSISKLNSNANEFYSQNKDECIFCEYNLICKLSGEPVTVSYRKKRKLSGYKTSIVTDFNTRQLEAINQHVGPLRIFASAGTGKTAVLAKRYDCMIKSGIDPSSILLISFSRKAVEELRQRISIITDLEDSLIKCFTYNGFCSGILSVFGQLITFNDLPLKVLSSVVRKKFIIQFLKKAPLIQGISYLEPFNEHGIVSKMESVITKILSSSRISHKIMDYTELRTVYKKYDDRFLSVCYECTTELISFMKSNNYITYNDQILMVKELFTSFPNISSYIANKYKYIMCDEFQDTSPEQCFIIYNIAKHHNNICICGDDSQSIYKFRGADNSNILQFNKHFKDCVDIILNVNYRSNSGIINLGESIISKNVNRIPKLVKAVKHSSAAVSYTKVSSVDTVIVIIQRILQFAHPGDIAIIARTNSTLQKIHSKLVECSIPARLNQSGADNSIELLRIINFLSVVFRKCTDVDRYLFGLINGTKLNDNDIDLFIDSFWDSVDHCEFHCQLQTVFNYILPGADVILFINELIENENISSLQSLNLRLYELIYYKECVPIENELNNEVTLITSHSSKGKEYNYVVIPDICEFVDKNDMEEARRVLFVAITRAKVQVYVCSKGESEFTQDILGFLST